MDATLSLNWVDKVELSTPLLVLLLITFVEILLIKFVEILIIMKMLAKKVYFFNNVTSLLFLKPMLIL